MTSLAIPKAEGDYTTFKHRVYIGVFHPHPEVMFIKVGMTSNVQERIRAYAGMVPGGLNAMYTTNVESRGAAMRAETAVMCALGSSGNFRSIGGEWFQCEPVQKLAAVDELEKVGRGLSQARIVSPEPFVDGKRGKKRPARRRR
jgi:hypothetical protein